MEFLMNVLLAGICVGVFFGTFKVLFIIEEKFSPKAAAITAVIGIIVSIAGFLTTTGV